MLLAIMVIPGLLELEAAQSVCPFASSSQELVKEQIGGKSIWFPSFPILQPGASNGSIKHFWFAIP